MIYFGWKLNAGLVCLCWRGWSLHLIVKREHWTWGVDRDWYDGEIITWGAGPLGLVCWCEAVDWMGRMKDGLD